MKVKMADLTDFLKEDTTKSNKELLVAAGICTAIGIIIGFLIGKASTSKNTIKKYNKCFSYDFGDEEEFEE